MVDTDAGAVEFGVARNLLHDAKEEARHAERLGFDILVTGEHLMFHGPVTNSMISLAVAAGATDRIQLMNAIALVPLYPAALLAKQASVLDVVSGGRFRLGVGIGGEFPKEFDAVGVPVSERGARTDEALEVINRLLTERDVQFRGRFTELDGVTLRPGPIQKPRFPIWVAGRKDRAMRRAAIHADGWMPYMYTPEQLAGSMANVAAFAAEAGRGRDAVRGGIFAFACVHEDRDIALDMANQQLSTTYNQDFSSLVGKYAIAGTPDDCVARIRQYIEAGARTVVLGQGCRPDHVERNCELLADHVVAALR